MLQFIDSCLVLSIEIDNKNVFQGSFLFLCRFIVTLLAFGWSSKAAMSFIGDTAPEGSNLIYSLTYQYDSKIRQGYHCEKKKKGENLRLG